MKILSFLDNKIRRPITDEIGETAKSALTYPISKISNGIRGAIKGLGLLVFHFLPIGAVQIRPGRSFKSGSFQTDEQQKNEPQLELDCPPKFLDIKQDCPPNKHGS
jgi:hypothetical protein